MAGIAVLALAVAVVPYPSHLYAPVYDPDLYDDPQSVPVGPIAASHEERDGYASELSPYRVKVALVASRDQYAWARLVLWYGGWPITDESVATITQWMRAENYVDSWWNRNNPLNNGWGTTGGTFLSGYVSLDDAAREAAEAIHTLGGYSGILQAFAGAVPNADAAAAIWASSWATGHYNGGSHWSFATVPSVVAPDDAWGL